MKCLFNFLKKKKKSTFFLLILIVFFIFVVSQVPPVWRLAGQPSHGHNLNYTPGDAGWVYYDQISKHMIHAAIIAEDARFLEHQGIDLIEIAKSAYLNIKHQRILRGGSTITQQLVKIAFLGPQRRFLRKFREALGALVLEWSLSKERILALYLNNVDYGRGAVGIKRAARRFFGVSPQLLTIEQSIRLVLVLPRPSKRSKDLVEERLTLFSQKRYRRIAERMFNVGYITKAQLSNCLAIGDFGQPIFGPAETGSLVPSTVTR